MNAVSAWGLWTYGADFAYLSRFFPCHLMNDRGPTPLDTLEKLAERARRHLRHVYLGNV